MMHSTGGTQLAKVRAALRLVQWMTSRITTLITAGTLVLLCLVGLFDSLRDDRSGPALLFALVAVGIVALASARTNAHGVTLRRDLASWLERVAPVTGETVEELNNRAVSRLRAGFGEPPENDQ